MAIFHTFKRQPKNRSNETKVTKELGIITAKLFIQKSFLPGTLILTHQWPYELDQCSAFYIRKLLSKTTVHTCKTLFPTTKKLNLNKQPRKIPKEDINLLLLHDFYLTLYKVSLVNTLCC